MGTPALAVPAPSRRGLRFGTSEVLFALSIGILLVVVAFPLLLIFVNAFWVDGTFNVVDVVKVLREKETYRALWNSLVLATGCTITGTVVGTFFAWVVTRTDLPCKGFMKVMFLVPFMLPAFIGALAWKMLLSPRSGWPLPASPTPPSTPTSSPMTPSASASAT